MTATLARLVGVTLLGLATAAPSFADSLASSASSAGSASVGSLSNSLDTSSDSSKPNKAVADGDYRVIDVAEVAGRPGMLRLQLKATQPRGDDGLVWLTLPQQALGPRGLWPGDIVSAHHRPYGVEFARAAQGAKDREAFFLALADDWLSELDPRALKL